MRILRILAVAMLAVTAGSPLCAQSPRATTAVTGAYRITFNLTVASSLPASSTLVCKAAITPILRSSDGSIQSLPLETVATQARISRGTAVCAVEIPFSWTLPDASTGADLSFEIDAVNPNGSAPALWRTSFQQGIPVAYPPSGGAASLTFNLVF
jgi:hypothetical protein